jgi:hypothetical protein
MRILAEVLAQALSLEPSASKRAAISINATRRSPLSSFPNRSLTHFPPAIMSRCCKTNEATKTANGSNQQLGPQNELASDIMRQSSYMSHTYSRRNIVAKFHIKYKK